MMTATEASGSPSDPTQAPLTLELLADLHAGVFDEPLAAQLRRRVAADSQAAAVLAALDATVADLAALPHQRTTPIPEGVARRVDTALAAERAGTDSPLEAGWAGAAATPALMTKLTSGMRRRHKAGWAGVAFLTVAAAVTGVVALSGLMLDSADAPPDTAIGIQTSTPLALTRSDPTSFQRALDQALTANDYGPLSPPQRLRNCLTANSAPTTPLGALKVTLDGRHGILLVLPTDRPTQFRLLIVTPTCNSTTPSPLADHLMTR